MKCTTMIGVFSTVSLIAFSACVYAADESATTKSSTDYKKNGGYSTSSSSSDTTAGGTTSETSNSKEDVDVDSSGKVKQHIESKSTVDPKGLMNKKTSESDTTVEEKDNGGYQEKREKESTNKAGTDYSNKSTTDVDVDSSGNVITTKERKETVDPKGLMNKKTTKTKIKEKNGQVIEEKSTTD